MSDDSALLAGLRAREEGAFEILVRAHRQRLLAVARRVLRDPEEAHDAVQDAFLLAFRGIDSFHEGRPLTPWLRRILINVSISRLRTRRPTLPLTEAPQWMVPGGAGAGGRASWDAALLRRELRDTVHACMNRLPAAYRAAVRLRYLNDMDTQETARALGESTGAVKGRLHRARLRMRRLLEAGAAPAPGRKPRAAAAGAGR